MWAWINVAVMVVLAVVTTAVYVRSVSPAALEKKIGPEAYAVCGRTRKVAMGLYMLFFVPYVLAAFYPPAPFPRGFPWPYWVSAVLGVLIAVPSTALMLVGVWHAGEETLLPRKEHTLYGGIYKVYPPPAEPGGSDRHVGHGLPAQFAVSGGVQCVLPAAVRLDAGGGGEGPADPLWGGV